MVVQNLEVLFLFASDLACKGLSSAWYGLYKVLESPEWTFGIRRIYECQLIIGSGLWGTDRLLQQQALGTGLWGTGLWGTDRLWGTVVFYMSLFFETWRFLFF